MSFNQVVIKNATRSVASFPKIAGTVYLKGAVIAKNLNNDATLPATSSTPRSSVLGVTTEAIAAVDARLDVLGLDIFSKDQFIIETTNNSNAAHYGDRMILTDSVTVNNTGTDDAAGIVFQVAVIGVPADKKILVEFV